MDYTTSSQSQSKATPDAIPKDDGKPALDYSGKLNIQIPKRLHFELSEEAKSNGVSLNQYIIYKLAR